MKGWVEYDLKPISKFTQKRNGLESRIKGLLNSMQEGCLSQESLLRLKIDIEIGEIEYKDTVALESLFIKSAVISLVYVLEDSKLKKEATSTIGNLNTFF